MLTEKLCPNRSEPRRILEDVQVLRAYAVAFVILQHTADRVQSQLLLRATQWGGFASGVDLFFVISGFVISRSLLPELDRTRDRHGRIRVLCSFWTRRAWRIWPAAWLWLMLILVASTLCNPSVFGSVRTNAWAALAGVLNVANIRFAQMFGGSYYGASFPYWSLSSEEQFYIVLPALAFFARRWLLPLACVFIALQVRYNNPIFYPISRDAELFYGVLLAMFCRTSAWRRVEPVTPRSGLLLVLPLNAVLFLLLLRAANSDLVVSIRYSVLPFVSAAIVWLASYDRGYIVSFGPAKRVFMWLGSRSFALYLVHVPVLLAVGAASSALSGPRRGSHLGMGHEAAIAAFAIMLALSDLTYRLVERPLRGYGKQLGDRVSV